MGSKLAQLLLLAVLASSIFANKNLSAVTALAADPKNSDNDLFENILSESTQNYVSPQSIRSFNFDNWLRCYLSGDEAGRQKAWEPAVRLAGKEGTVDLLIKHVLTRMSFGVDIQGNPRGHPTTAVQTMIADTEKYLGKNVWEMRVSYDYASFICMGSKRFAPAAVFKERELKLEEAKLGRESRTARFRSIELAELLFRANQFESSSRLVSVLEKMEKQRPDAEIDIRIAKLKAMLSHKAVTKH